MTMKEDGRLINGTKTPELSGTGTNDVENHDGTTTSVVELQMGVVGRRKSGGKETEKGALKSGVHNCYFEQWW